MFMLYIISRTGVARLDKQAVPPVIQRLCSFAPNLASREREDIMRFAYFTYCAKMKFAPILMFTLLF